MTAERLIMLAPGEVRPCRVPLPPAFAVKARKEDTEGRLSVMEMTLVHDIPRHVHLHADECVYVLEGKLEVEFEGRGRVVEEGAFVLLPHSVPHALRRAGDRPPRLLQMSAPGGFEGMIEDLVAAGPAVLRDGRLDPAALTALGLPHGIDYGIALDSGHCGGATA
jgi:quercetin dioxygenase-like cupin family protein